MQVTTEHPSAWQLLSIWGRIGLQSFGGGASTTYLIQHEFVEKQRWLTNEEMLHLWNLCIMAPGINLIAITILIGRKLAGVWGIAASLTGLLLPSAFISCLMTAGLVSIQHLPVVQAMLHGIVPATAGIMLLVGIKFSLPLLKTSRTEGTFKFALSLTLILATAGAIIVFRVAVVLVLICVALAGMGFFSTQPPVKPQPQPQEEEQ